jgi:hypothetical protein
VALDRSDLRLRGFAPISLFARYFLTRFSHLRAGNDARQRGLVTLVDLGTDKSDARTHRTLKALRAKLLRRLLGFAEAFGLRTRPRVAFIFEHA